ncbi:type II secretion system F family protein [Numidum massiliense]|uniref:type II secretion system F family protein n=1 Tax=Numidum massiliense TaxID=1522315 RepID=UPI0006D59707|nr:type II secretion system F family protein [Numidum massiliense]
MTIYAILAVILIVALLVLKLRAGKRYDEFVEEYKDGFQLTFMAPIPLYILDRFKLMERFYGKIAFVQQKMISLYGLRYASQYTKMYLAQVVSAVILCFLGGVVFALVAEGDHVIFVVGCFITVMIPMMMFRSLTNQEKERRHDIIIELPEFVNKVILLVNAGETVQQAIVRCVELKQDDEDNPLYVELREVVNKMATNEPFQQVLEGLSKKCGIQEVSIFTTTVLLNYRKGGHDLVLSLRELSQDLWEKRKLISKTKGEEASSKLVFPLLLIFIAVMIIVGWPALKML